MIPQEEHWYKPQKGEPHRPLIALPAQIRKMNAPHGTCQGNFFNGIDPPKSLVPATAMIQTTTSEDPKATIATAMPVFSPDAGAKNTATDVTLTRASFTTPTVEQAKETSSMVLDPKQGAPDPQIHVDSPALIMPQVQASTQPGFGPRETSSNFRQGISIGGYPTQAGNHDTPSPPFQNIASVRPIVSSDPASTTAPTSQGFDPANAKPTVTRAKPNPPSEHLEAALPGTNDTPQDPSQTNQNQRPDPPRIAGADDVSTLRTAVASVPLVDHMTYPSHVDSVSNIVSPSHADEEGDPAISAVAVQIGLAPSANNIAVGGNNIPTEAPAPGATTTPLLHESLILDINEVASPISSIENPKFGVSPIISHTTAVTIPAVDVVKTPLLGMLNIATVDGTHMIPGTPGHVPSNPKPGVPEHDGQTISSEAVRTKIDDTRDHSNPGLPTGKAGSTVSSDKFTSGSPTGKAGSTNTGDHGTSVLPPDKVGSSSSGTQIPEATYGTGDHSTSIPPTGAVGSTGTGKQPLEGRARGWGRSVGWKRAGFTGLLMAILL